MNPNEIATAAIAILSPYVALAGEAAAKKVGEAAWNKAAEIHKAIKDRLSKEKDDYPQKTMARFEEKPSSRKAALEDVLTEIIQKDAKFAKSLSKLLKEAEDNNVGAIFNTNVYGGKVGDIINIDKVEGNLTLTKKND